MRKIFLAAALLVFAACGNKAGVVTEHFGTLSDGQEVQLFTLVNSSGAKVCLSDYGARVVSIFVPGKDGKLDDVVPGPGDVETFEKGDRFMGCTIGRYGNRINHSSFEIDGVRYRRPRGFRPFRVGFRALFRRRCLRSPLPSSEPGRGAGLSRKL